ncbi:recombinase family protein [Ammoniphilus resinae]|uniref:DNA invertase Pin-like site-specific DNA recombinase n=1 Tax=Ammoniphilus resinae TaxID=861532 RepID=A0ABS4GNQ9_9BACL|nr:recombinase family protein [Ammoniphilus resinae]MBP1931907.1 DNA invertase Pin-like site-specific DNA recombinase [Ammoniphilus resinae]
MKIGYARVSTHEQNLEMQIDALKQFGCEEIFTEKVSGTKDDRPQLGIALKTLRSGDLFVCYKLDRIARSTKKLIEISETLEQRKVELGSLQDHIDTSTAIGKAMFKMLAVIAELEADIIRERTLAGLASARARGRKGGRPTVGSKQIEKAVKLYESKTVTLREIKDMTGISPSTLYKYLKKGN